MNRCYTELPGRCFPRCREENDVEKNIAKAEAKQVFNFGPIRGSVITGAVTNTQTQVVVNLAFDEIEISL